ncbi:MAG: hypothetical protein A3G81_25130 [Betaproteobacteria bacterium RIFCSPLOWO2_12_FULL_65_14]|nr:MAG: hypothetical protein A3G81_25130 [Betaproteobacteria bacterium RIFCSPLOWO2_12_FULL_65_14]
MRSLRSRLSLLLAAVFLLVLSGIGGTLYVFLNGEMRERDAAELVAKRELVRHFLRQAGSVRKLLEKKELLHDALVGHERLHVALLDESGALLFASSGASAGEGAIESGRVRIASGPNAPRLVVEGAPFLAASEQVQLTDAAQPPLWMIVALETTEHQLLLRAYLQGLVVTLAAGALLAALAGSLAIRHALAPVARIARTAEHISASRLDQRIPVEDTPSELMQLVQGFNAMLERLADSFRRLSEFSWDLSHELRAPIHSLLGHAQVALSHPRPAEEYRNVLETIVEEGERLARTVRDMLFLAQAENAALSVKREPVMLRAELDTVVSFFQPLADERGVTVTASGDATVLADRNMVQRAITNLLSNALRHVPAGGNVSTRIAPNGGEIWLEVSNTGTAIPPEVAARIFDRFYRADMSPRDETEGTGLGLAIVKSIMGIHGGAVELAASQPDITTFRLRFPA